MEKRVAEHAYYVLNNLWERITAEDLQTIASMNIGAIIREFNRGKTDVLDREDLNIFLKSNITVRDIITYIKDCQELLLYKENVLAEIERQKSEFRYDPNAIYFKRESYGYRYNYLTYAEVLKAIELAEEMLNNKDLYLLLKNLLKFETIREELEERKVVLTALKTKDERRDLLEETIDRGDSRIGIIQILESQKAPKIVAGSKKDLAISEIIGVPFPADADEEGYEYGPHGDYYQPPYKCEKFFHEPETKTHLEMVRTEVQKRRDALYAATDEQGYIYKKGVALSITAKELAENGIDPETVGWKPVRVTPKRISVLSLRDYRGFRLPLKEQIVIKAKTL